MKNLKARVGETEIAASASMTRTGKRRIEADVASPVFDLTPFLVKETRTEKPPPKLAAKKFVFGEEPLPLEIVEGTRRQAARCDRRAEARRRAA